MSQGPRETELTEFMPAGGRISYKKRAPALGSSKSGRFLSMKVSRRRAGRTAQGRHAPGEQRETNGDPPTKGDF